MIVEETPIKNLLLVKPEVYSDQRGEFLEVYREHRFKELGLDIEYVQDNISTSRKNVIRGLHYQLPPASQVKLVMVVHGKILDIAVDLRPHSPTFGNHFSAELSSENRQMLLVPSGFAHGFSVLSDEATVYYKCNDYYNRELERGIRWDDPDLNIDWKVENPVLSEKDKTLPLLKEMEEDDLF